MRLAKTQQLEIEKDLIRLEMCCCCDTDYKIIGHLASLERHIDESEGKCFAIRNRKNHSQYRKIHATQKNA